MIAGQAFHWFDPERAAAEARRVLVPGGWAALIWNDRPATGTPFLEGYEALLKAYGIDYERISHRHVDDGSIGRFFAPERPRVAYFDNRAGSTATTCSRWSARRRTCRRQVIPATPR